MQLNAINPLWRLADPLTVVQAAALTAGFDPNTVRSDESHSTWWFESETGVTDTGGSEWIKTAFAALTNAIRAEKLPVNVLHDARPADNADALNLYEMMECSDEHTPSYDDLCDEGETYSNGHFVKDEPNWNKTLVDVGSLREWLLSRGLRSGFFFPTATDAPDYLDPNHPRYPRKLAAAVRAWQSVTDAGGKHPKQALMKWLREHAAEFGLTDDEGKVNELGIEEAAKVANWQPGGGAPKTPGE